MNAYYAVVAAVQIMTLIQIIVLLYKLWSFKKIERKIKIDWTWLLILFTPIAAIVFIWSRFDSFNKLNKKNVLSENN